MSDQIWFQRINGSRDGFDGFWMCPTPNCGGAGFTFDIFPTDPNHPANEGWCDSDVDENESAEEAWQEPQGAIAEYELEVEEPDTEYDPDEPHYKMLDEWADDDDDIEGEEWKHGLEPGQKLEDRRDRSKPDWVIEQEKKYDEPDARPRELDWSDREQQITEDDIPF